MIGRLLTAVALAGALVLAVHPLPTTRAAFTAGITDTASTVGTNPYFTCARTEGAGADGATAVFAWPLNESVGTTAVDVSGHGANGTYRGQLATATTPSACPRDPGPAYRADGSTAYVTSPTRLTSPTTFTIETWFATTVPSGKLIGFGNAATGPSTAYDRHIYLTTSGRLTFGVYNGATRTITSPNAYADGLWHHVAVTFSPTAGARLYVDGSQVAADPSITTAESTSGWWRVGYDNQNGWPGTGADPYFTGTLRYAAAYTSALTPQQIASHAAAGR